MLLNCGVEEDSWEFLGLQGVQTSQSKRKSILNIHWKDWYWTEAPILWLPNVKSQFIRKDPDAGKGWRQDEKGTTEDEMVGWHHQFNGHEFEQAPANGEAQGSLACCSPRGRKELDTTEWLNSNNLHEGSLFVSLSPVGFHSTILFTHHYSIIQKRMVSLL